MVRKCLMMSDVFQGLDGFNSRGEGQFKVEDNNNSTRQQQIHPL